MSVSYTVELASHSRNEFQNNIVYYHVIFAQVFVYRVVHGTWMDTNFDAQFANHCQWGSTKSIALKV